MNVLITGGTGLIGTAFIKQFNNLNFTVLVRSIAKAKATLPAHVALISSLDQLANLDDFDAVINLAGEPIIDKRWRDKQKDIICQSRWHTTEQLVALFARSSNPPKVFISGSAIGIYSDRGDDELPETAAVSACDFPSTLCSTWEQIATKASPYTRVVTLRTGIVLSTQGGALKKLLLPFKCFVGGPISHGQQYMSWIHYQDMIHGIYFLLSADKVSGPVNMVAPEPLPNRVFTQTLAGVLNRFAIIPAPKLMLWLGLGESSCLLVDSQRVVPQVLIKHGYDFKFSNLKAALKDLLIKL